jgi:hypothetical protein
MEDNSGKMKVAWSMGKGKIPNGPDFANTTGTIYLDSFGWDQIIVAKGDVKGTPFKFDKLSASTGSTGTKFSATIVLIRAMPEDHNGVDIYKYLKYSFAGENGDRIGFGESPLMLIGSVANYVDKNQDIIIWYNPDEVDNSTEGVGKAAATPQPPNKATISILVGVSVIKKTPPGSTNS